MKRIRSAPGEGRPVDPNANARSAYTRSLVDTRHEALNAFTRLRDPKTGDWARSSTGKFIQRDFGLEQILALPAKLEAAIEGNPVYLRLEVIDVDGKFYRVHPDDLHEALADKSYHRCGTMEEFKRRCHEGQRGFYLIEEVRDLCHIVYARSPSTLHLLAVRENGDKVLYDGALGGYSNNGGTTLADLALDLMRSGFTEAICLDNGGDVALVKRGHAGSTDWPDPNGTGAVVPSSLTRKHWAALLLYQGESPAGLDIRLDATGTVDSDGVGWFKVSW